VGVRSGVRSGESHRTSPGSWQALVGMT